MPRSHIKLYDVDNIYIYMYIYICIYVYIYICIYIYIYIYTPERWLRIRNLEAQGPSNSLQINLWNTAAV